MNREKKLLSNVVIFAIGNIGSKLIQFLLIPVYTGILNPSQYGTVDLLQTISMLLIPIFSLSISESVFRYGMDPEENKKEIFSLGILITTMGSIVLGVAIVMIQWVIGNIDYIYYVVAYTIVSMFRNVTSQFLRAIGKVKIYTIDNVIQTTGIILFNLIFLFSGLGIDGYMMGYICGNLLSIITGILMGKLWQYVKFTSWKNGAVKRMLLFSIPLIPNTICWWISSSSDKMMLTAFIGTAANGLYSIAHKIPSILTIVVGIFIQAWQITANEEYNKEDTSEFYSKIFNMLVVFSFVCSSFIMLLSKFEIRIISNSQYYDAWSIMIALLIGTTYYTFAQFLGTIYTANKKTAMAMFTNLFAAIINVCMNYVLIPKFGALGAAAATSFSYFCLWLSRIITTQKIVRILCDWKKLVLCSVILLAQSVIQISEIKYHMILSVICTVFMLLINYKMIKAIVVSMFAMIKR